MRSISLRYNRINLKPTFKLKLYRKTIIYNNDNRLQRPGFLFILLYHFENYYNVYVTIKGLQTNKNYAPEILYNDFDACRVILKIFWTDYSSVSSE